MSIDRIKMSDEGCSYVQLGIWHHNQKFGDEFIKYPFVFDTGADEISISRKTLIEVFGYTESAIRNMMVDDNRPKSIGTSDSRFVDVCAIEIPQILLFGHVLSKWKCLIVPPNDENTTEDTADLSDLVGASALYLFNMKIDVDNGYINIVNLKDKNTAVRSSLNSKTKHIRKYSKYTMQKSQLMTELKGAVSKR